MCQTPLGLFAVHMLCEVAFLLGACVVLVTQAAARIYVRRHRQKGPL